jgi:NitT/TauT family transport system substrate-binding protein
MAAHQQHRGISRTAPSRRRLLKAVAGTMALPFAGLLPRLSPAAPLKPLKLAWITGAVCGAPAAVAKHQGLFEKHGLGVEFVHFAGPTGPRLEASC